jgi:hypothetical protein
MHRSQRVLSSWMLCISYIPLEIIRLFGGVVSEATKMYRSRKQAKFHIGETCLLSRRFVTPCRSQND